MTEHPRSLCSGGERQTRSRYRIGKVGTHTKKVSIEEGRGFLTSRMDTLTPLPWGTRVGKSPVLSGQSEEAAGSEELQSVPDTMQAGKENPGEPGQSWRLVLALEAGVCFGDFGSLRW